MVDATVETTVAPSESVLTTVDGLALPARRWIPATPTRAAVVLVHGFSASSHDGAVVRQAEALCEAGFEVTAYDSRGHGRAGGECTLGDLESHDVAAAARGAGSDGLPVVLVGASMGAISVLRHAATTDQRLAGVVTVSCPAAWRAPRSVQGALAAAMTQTRLGRRIAARRLGVRLSPVWTNAAPPTTLVAQLHVPVAVIHGQADHFIRPCDAVELFRHAPEPRRLDLVPGMGHAYDALAVSPVVSAVEWVLAASLRTGVCRAAATATP
jgi:pimeloyl-ACP methyl ester carboxylesterase